MNAHRRSFLRAALGSIGVAAGTRAIAQTPQHQHPTPPEHPQEVPRPASSPMATSDVSGGVPVECPDLARMPWTLDNDVKVFHITAEPVRTEFLPGRIVDAWGFNGSMPGPTIEVNQGDRVRFIVENRLPEVFSMHWHGVEVPNDMDGVPGLIQDPIPPGDRFIYEFTVHQHGTFFYHSHMAMQEMLGMIGLFIIHPGRTYRPAVHRDFGLIFQGWAILPNNTVPNTLSMEFNWLTINGKAGPATTPMLVKAGERVRIRMVNLGMDHHPVHLHGNTFYTVGTEAGRIPESGWEPGNTVLLGVAQARDIEFEAKYPGDWMLHCHLPHHMMNQMVSIVGPMGHAGAGLHAGMGMPEGMGIIREGHALDETSGASLGRALGFGSEFERQVTHAPLAPSGAPEHAGHTMQPAQGEDPRSVPGYPQDMFMVMDETVAKPETLGLRPTWSGGVMGMMTLVRVLEPELFDRIQAMKAEQAGREGRG